MAQSLPAAPNAARRVPANTSASINQKTAMFVEHIPEASTVFTPEGKWSGREGLKPLSGEPDDPARKSSNT